MLTILTDENKLLRKKCKKIAKIDDCVRNLAANMIQTMLSSNGVGLAANQVGILKRIIIILVNDKPIAMINPEITYESEEQEIIKEGCLSFPNTFLSISRSKEITVKYRNLSGHPMIETYTGLIARCILHEVDHLHGITFKDNLNIKN
jgi:peptide deformylase